MKNRYILLLLMMGLSFKNVPSYSQNKADFDTSIWHLGNNTTITEFDGLKTQTDS